MQMEQIYITNVEIQKVRHLMDISIPLAENQMKHLFFTGKNGSGKTSVIEAMAEYLDHAFQDKFFEKRELWVEQKKGNLDRAVRENKSEEDVLKFQKEFDNSKGDLEDSRKGLIISFNGKRKGFFALKEKYHYILAYYRADRIFKAVQPRHVEKVQLKDFYEINESPRNDFVKYLLDLKMTEALARSNGKTEKADEIALWFRKLEKLLKKVFDDDSIRLAFDEETFQFSILEQGRESFDFNTLSSGYQAVLDIVLDIIMRMESQLNRTFDFNLSGIVLIDEIETHLHLELQRNIMPLLTTVFPNIQFIVTTHSPFILNSIDNAVIYDLEKHLLVQNGLDNVPYDGIVEGYFGADKLSNTLKEKFERYKKLVAKTILTDDELSEIAELELYLDEIPDYLAIGISTEYRRLKLEFTERTDLNG